MKAGELRKWKASEYQFHIDEERDLTAALGRILEIRGNIIEWQQRMDIEGKLGHETGTKQKSRAAKDKRQKKELRKRKRDEASTIKFLKLIGVPEEYIKRAEEG